LPDQRDAVAEHEREMIAARTSADLGGSSGIGYSMAEAFLDAGSTIIICARGERRLLDAQWRRPNLQVRAQHPGRQHFQCAIDLAKCVDEFLAGDKEIRININVQPLSCGSNPQTQAARRAIHRKLQNEIHDNKGVLADLETLLKPTHRLRQGWFLGGQEGGHEQSRRAAEALCSASKHRAFSSNFSTRKIDQQSRETIQGLLPAANRDLAFLEVASEGDVSPRCQSEHR